MPILRRDHPLVVGLDFDGVVVANNFPKPKFHRIGAEKWIPQLQEEFEIRVILYTCRVNHDPRKRRSDEPELPLDMPRRMYLDEAYDETVAQGIRIWGINSNPAHEWWDPGKPHCDIYIDDKNLGTPLVQLKHEPNPCLDWNWAGRLLYTTCLDHDAKHKQGVYYESPGV